MTENNNELYLRGDVVIANNYFEDGSIQHGERPYLIISNNKCNMNSPTITAIPLTTKIKPCIPTHYVLYINGRRNTILAEQICCISKDSIIEYVDTLDDEDIKIVEEKVKIQLAL